MIIEGHASIITKKRGRTIITCDDQVVDGVKIVGESLEKTHEEHASRVCYTHVNIILFVTMVMK